jgi:flagellar protein FliO/FliZ
MTESKKLTRAISSVAAVALGLATLAYAMLACAAPALAFTPTHKGGGESTPLNLSSTPSSSHSTGGGPSILRTIIGLLIVIGIIWGLSWVLRKVKSGRETRAAGTGLTSVATLPLSPGRSLHVVRAGREYVLVGSSEHHIATIRHYTEEEALEAGLFEPVPATEWEDNEDGPISTGPGEADPTRPRDMQIPGQPGVQNPVGTVVDKLRGWTVRR